MSKVLKKIAQVHDSIVIEVSKTRQEDDGPCTIYVNFKNPPPIGDWADALRFVKPIEDIEHEVISTKIKK